ncbi:3D (Asp-Asp-Asp) domain-containing protein [Pullulanibacillus pueri]|uniref:3D domain-containing protein n=1 Tax=Pullulanibacillus pueri TaxID=1437324 RepID=A0A8J2ZZD8_9BACL|nr:3D domain-containing protein [Pullulanibacillus pueri]MBM7680486.1 3D (Asp-Asp-Asp) domain-containing protein [Pullulanibacillus pueri]GGH88211.1 hypothetical protein GCM10007096_40030 [Pullulanibacillus pueri]
MKWLTKGVLLMLIVFTLFLIPKTSLAAGKQSVSDLFIPEVHGHLPISSNNKDDDLDKHATYLKKIPHSHYHKSAKEYMKKIADKQHKKNTIEVKATAYTAQCKGCSGITKSGYDLEKHPQAKVIAVDPDVIPLGSTLYVPGYGVAKAADTGGAIDGHHIDVYFHSNQDAREWGVKHMNVTILSS